MHNISKETLLFASVCIKLVLLYRLATTMQVCNEHLISDAKCEHYCSDCKKFICILCTQIGKHSKHSYCTSEKAVAQYKNKLKESANKIDEMINDLSEGVFKITEIEKQRDDIIREIENYYSKLERKLREQREYMKQQVNDAVEQKKGVLRKQLKNVDQTKEKMLKMKPMYDAPQKKSYQEILVAMDEKQMIDDCSFNPSSHKINLQPEETNNIKLLPPNSLTLPQFFHLSVCSISNNSELLIPDETKVKKEVTATLLTKDGKSHYCSIGGNKVSMQLEESTGEIKPLEVKDYGDGSYVASFQGDHDGDAKLHVSINGLGIMKSPHSITMLRNYQHLRLPDKIENNSRRMGKPWGIALGKYGVYGQ